MKALDTLIPANLAETVGVTLMHAIWQLAAIAALLMLVLYFVRRTAFRTRYAMGVGALALMLALPIATFLYMYTPATTQAAGTAETALLLPGISQIPDLVSSNSGTIFTGISTFFSANAQMLVLIWLIGAAIFAIRFAGGFFHVQRLRNRNTAPVPTQVQATLARLQDQLGIRRAVTLLQSSSVDTPMVIGALKPVILLPMGLLSGLTTEQVECVLAHELAHIRRWDYLVNILQSIVEIVLFFHPATWWVSKMVREERENCCDEVVLALKHNKLVYARALLNLEAIRVQPPQLAMATTGGSLFKRIKRITGAETREKRTYSRGILLGLATLITLVLISTAGGEEMKASAPLFNMGAPELTFAESQYGDEADDQKDTDTNDTVSATTTESNTTTTEKKSDCSKKCTSNTSCYGRFFQRAAAQTCGMKTVASLADDIGTEVGRWCSEDLFPAVMHLASMVQDSPITKIMLNDDGKDVIVELDDNGDIEKVTIDGQVADESTHDKYRDMTAQSFRKYLHGGNHHRHGAPHAPHVGALPPMPALPNMNIQMPNVPMPAMPDMSGDFDEEEFEAQMEKFGAEMERWGEEFGKQMESVDWDKYAAEMEVWAEDFAKQFDEEEWEAFGAKMEAMGKRWEDVGERMADRWEDWGERLASRIERQVEAEMRREEARQDRADHMRERAEELAEREHERADRMRDRAEEMADRERDRADRIRSRYTRGMEMLEDNLAADGLVSKGKGFKIRINDEEMFVNGQRVSSRDHGKYKRMLETMLDTDIDDEWVKINRKKGSTKIQN